MKSIFELTLVAMVVVTVAFLFFYPTNKQEYNANIKEIEIAKTVGEIETFKIITSDKNAVQEIIETAEKANKEILNIEVRPATKVTLIIETELKQK